jgi:hypothetical protein
MARSNAFYSNGKIKPNRCIVGGKEEEHPEGSYYLYHKKSWMPVGADALDAQRQRNAQLDNYELKGRSYRSCHVAVPRTIRCSGEFAGAPSIVEKRNTDGLPGTSKKSV